MKVKDVQHGKTTRKSFARINEILEMPNLIEVQKKSYQWFLDEGLREVFADTASITDYTGNLELSFLDYSMDEAPKYSVCLLYTSRRHFGRAARYSGGPDRRV